MPDPTAPDLPPIDDSPKCAIKGCDRRRSRRGWCEAHYQRWRTHGDPLKLIGRSGPRRKRDPLLRLLERLTVPPLGGGCWDWTGPLNDDGYGRFYLGPQPGDEAVTHSPYAAAYRLFIGPIPRGKQLDHLCNRPSCANPLHLRPATSRENTLRSLSFSAVHARATHCPAGHPYDDANTYVNPRGSRECRTCHRIRSTEWARRKRESRAAA
jgi:hypothetical protein